jgi:membrane protein implicated in regulation of membrane protease activity
MTRSTVDLYYSLRVIGRFAFPIYCFLLAEGAHCTRNPKKYALRMAIGAVLSELPYDLAFYGGWTMENQSVMITLLLGFGALEAITVGLTSIWFVVGGIGGLVVSMLNGPIWLQLLVFFVVSIGCMIAARPLVVKYINQATTATNADRVLGAVARVTEAIDNTVPVGAVYVDGKTWSARSVSGEPIAQGTMVRVKRMEGVRLFVEESKEEA